jgi:hypothetical protein
MTAPPGGLDLAVRAARQHARDLASVLAAGASHLRVPAHVSAEVVAHVHHIVLERQPDPVRRHERDLCRDLALARDLACLLAGSRTGPEGDAAAALAARLDADLELASTLGGDPDRARALVRRLDREHGEARRLAPGPRVGGHAGPGVVCRQVVAGAVRVLPSQHQARYAREYAAELWELSSQPGMRRRRFAYALRLGATCWSLRRALSRPAVSERVWEG